MFVPVWLIVGTSLVFGLLAVWSFLWATGRNPLPFPDSVSRIFSAASSEGKDAVVALLARHGVRERFRFDTGSVLRSIMWDGTIINLPSREVLDKLESASSSIGLVAADPVSSAHDAVTLLRARGFDVRVVLDAEPDLPIAFVVTSAMPGTVINFRKHVIHLPRPQPAPKTVG